MRCANPSCGREFTPNTVRQKYCDVICSDKMQHAKQRQRAKLGRLNTAYKAEHTQQQEDDHIAALVKAQEDRQREEEAALFESVTGFKSKRKADIPVPDEPDKPMKLDDI